MSLAEEFFKRWDKDGNGTLSHAEIKHKMQEHGFDHGDYTDLWYRYDKNEDGTLDLKEFVRLFNEKITLHIVSKKNFMAELRFKWAEEDAQAKI